MNRYGVSMVAAGMLLTVAACGGSDAAPPVASETPVIPVTSPPPPPKPTPKPVDPTTVAKQKILADYATSFAFIQKGILTGGGGYPYETWMVGEALSSIKANMGFIKVVRRAKVTGQGKLLESKVSALDLKAGTATVTACAIDGYTAVASNGVVLARPPGKIAKIDKVKLLKGRWILTYTDSKVPSFGCSR